MVYTKNDLIYPYELDVVTYDATVNKKMRLECILQYQQQSGEDQLEVFDRGYNDLYDMGYAFVVTNTAVQINRMPDYTEHLRLETWSRGIRGAKFFRSYNWYGRNDELLIEASSVFVVVDINEHKLKRADSIDRNIPFDTSKLNAVGNPSKIFLPDEETMKYVGEKRIVFSQLDGNAHLNNAFYTDFLLDYTADMQKKIIKSFAIDFISEARLDDVVKVYSATENGVTYFYGEHERGRCFRAKCIYQDI